MLGVANWMRMSDASIPATTKKTKAKMMYIKPSRLWSTVTSQEWMWSNTVFSVAAIEPRGIAVLMSPVVTVPFI